MTGSIYANNRTTNVNRSVTGDKYPHWTREVPCAMCHAAARTVPYFITDVF